MVVAIIQWNFIHLFSLFLSSSWFSREDITKQKSTLGAIENYVTKPLLIARGESPLKEISW